MKTKMLYSVLVFSFLLAVAGCKKDIIEPDGNNNPPAKLFGTAKPNSDTVVKGGSVTFTINSNADSCVANLSNGWKCKVPTNGMYSFKLNQDTYFDFVFYKKGNTPCVDSHPIFAKEATVLDPTVSITIEPSTADKIPRGTVLIVHLLANNFDILESNIPGFQGLPGDFSVVVTEDITFNAVAKKGDKTATANVTVTTEPMFPYPICEHPWQVLCVEGFLNNHWDTLQSPPDFLAEATFFYENGSVEKYLHGVLVANNGTWNFFSNNDSLEIAGWHYRVNLLNVEQMILTREMLYWHPNPDSCFFYPAKYTYLPYSGSK